MKRALVAATLVLVAGGGLVGCGSDDDSDDSSASSSSSASSDSTASSSGDGGEFCQAFTDFGEALNDVDPSAAPADIVSEIKAEADKLDDVDLPADISDEAEAGFKVVIGAIEDLPDDASLEDLSNLEAKFTDEDKANAQSFNDYLAQTCPELSGDDPSASTVAPEPSESAS